MKLVVSFQRSQLHFYILLLYDGSSMIPVGARLAAVHFGDLLGDENLLTLLINCHEHAE